MTADLLSSEVERAAAAILARFEEHTDPEALLVGISGIDGSGKGFVTERIVASLRSTNLRAVSINVDGWLELPHVRFSEERPADRFYARGLRLDEMFEKLVLPLKRERSIRLDADYTEETATSYRPHTYAYDDVDVIVLEGIYLFKKQFQELFDLHIWIECSFETALSSDGWTNGLEGNSFPEFEILSLVDFSHPPLADEVQDSKALGENLAG